MTHESHECFYASETSETKPNTTKKVFHSFIHSYIHLSIHPSIPFVLFLCSIPLFYSLRCQSVHSLIHLNSFLSFIRFIHPSHLFSSFLSFIYLSIHPSNLFYSFLHLFIIFHQSIHPFVLSLPSFPLYLKPTSGLMYLMLRHCYIQNEHIIALLTHTEFSTARPRPLQIDCRCLDVGVSKSDKTKLRKD